MTSAGVGTDEEISGPSLRRTFSRLLKPSISISLITPFTSEPETAGVIVLCRWRPSLDPEETLMTTFVSDLAPQPLWKHFDQILTIPRGSKNEEAVRRHVLGIAERKGLRTRTDAAGNVVVAKPASPGKEGAPTVVLQSHLDMVNEKNSDVTHDFERDPIVPRRDGEFVKATGTTLGADNDRRRRHARGLEADGLVHGPLEFIFTTTRRRADRGERPDSLALSGKLLLNLTPKANELHRLRRGGMSNRRWLGDWPFPAGRLALAGP